MYISIVQSHIIEFLLTMCIYVCEMYILYIIRYINVRINVL